ncbi:hypothetical protein SAMN02745196_00165 [Clostridium collagenovorans DSM 3089]|uniref:SGNH/GDSL hydrolase family protein n=1 Tax=Clostridium collagenovorans DSM 3089 TaxID=1121306 RepID=A0A1M5SHI9_9CLOT|nr:hypothetical protein [Clostridium collagenovorans]SHH37738.1 hypothetical protein SAMN02745196_00165 [Clostridium collagenovorans DSM 3089]
MRFKNIIKPVAFLGIFVLILVVVSLFFTPKATDKGVEKEEANTIDYLVIGDSEAYASIEPMEIWNEYGFTGYNLGVPGQRLQDTYYLLQKSLQNQSPKVVMLETNSIHRSANIGSELNKVVDSMAKENISIYKDHDDWKNVFDSKKREENNKKRYKEGVLKGAYYNRVVNAYKNGPYVKQTNDIEEIKSVPMYYLNKIVELCKEKNIKLILYTSPSPICWSYAKYNRIKSFAEDNELNFMDLNLNTDELNIDWEKDTHDKGDHVNFSGARKVTRYISEYLYQNTDLTDHRNDKKYDSWKKNLEEYLKLIGEN